jgi:hypothetical protein
VWRRRTNAVARAPRWSRPSRGQRCGPSPRARWRERAVSPSHGRLARSVVSPGAAGAAPRAALPWRAAGNRSALCRRARGRARARRQSAPCAEVSVVGAASTSTRDLRRGSSRDRRRPDTTTVSAPRAAADQASRHAGRARRWTRARSARTPQTGPPSLRSQTRPPPQMAPPRSPPRLMPMTPALPATDAPAGEGAARARTALGIRHRQAAQPRCNRATPTPPSDARRFVRTSARLCVLQACVLQARRRAGS